MKLSLIAAFALFSGLAFGAGKIDIPVETTDVVIDQHRAARWEEYRSIPHEKAVELISAGKSAGAACHELPVEQIVVCYFADYQPKTVGIDFQKLREALGAQGECTPGDVHKTANGATANCAYGDIWKQADTKAE